jgi:hypothetical protein
MSDLFWLTDEQMARLQPFFPRSHGRPRVDDRRVLSGIIFINRNGLRWRDGNRGRFPCVGSSQIGLGVIHTAGDSFWFRPCC